jgi:hypothetical protein
MVADQDRRRAEVLKRAGEEAAAARRGENAVANAERVRVYRAEWEHRFTEEDAAVKVSGLQV